MRAHRGFTLLEMAVVIAIVALVAALAIPSMRASRRNASVASAAFELSLWLDGLRTRAMRDQRDLVAVVADAASPQMCANAGGNACGRFVLLQPDPAFTLNALQPATQAYPNAAVLQDELLPRGLAFYVPAVANVGPPPYHTIAPFDPELLGACGGRQCIGVRFRGDGTVEPEWPTGVAGATKGGVAFVLGSELSRSGGVRMHEGADQRSVIVTFPAGIVKTFSVAR